jgi:hypothetical protein
MPSLEACMLLHLQELSCVDDTLVILSQCEAAAWVLTADLSCFCCKLCLLCCSSHAVRATPEVLFLDMGAYKLALQHNQATAAAEATATAAAAAGKDPCLPHSDSYSSNSSNSISVSRKPGRLQFSDLFQLGTSAVAALHTRKAECSTAAPAAAAAAGTARSRSGSPMAAQLRPKHAAAAAAMVVELGPGCGDQLSQQQQQQQQQCGEELLVYQVLHPLLVGRAHVFGNELQLLEVQQVTDLPFFDAPGEPAMVCCMLVQWLVCAACWCSK